MKLKNYIAEHYLQYFCLHRMYRGKETGRPQVHNRTKVKCWKCSCPHCHKTYKMGFIQKNVTVEHKFRRSLKIKVQAEIQFQPLPVTNNEQPKSPSKSTISSFYNMVDCVWNVMAHAQKPDFVFRRNGQVHLNQQGRQFSRLLAPEVCATARVMLDTPCSDVVWSVLATHSIHKFPLHFPSCASPCAITFQLDSTHYLHLKWPDFLMINARHDNKHSCHFN